MRLYLANIKSENCMARGFAKYCPNKADATKHAKQFCREEGLPFCLDSMVIPVEVKPTKKGILNLLIDAEHYFVHDLGGGYVE